MGYDAGADVVAATPRWVAGAYGLPMQAPLVPKFQLEGPNGWEKDDWAGSEFEEVRVPTGGIFRVWIGFDLDISKDPDRRNAEIRR